MHVTEFGSLARHNGADSRASRDIRTESFLLKSIKFASMFYFHGY